MLNNLFYPKTFQIISYTLQIYIKIYYDVFTITIFYFHSVWLPVLNDNYYDTIDMPFLLWESLIKQMHFGSVLSSWHAILLQWISSPFCLMSCLMSCLRLNNQCQHALPKISNRLSDIHIIKNKCYFF